MISAPLYFFATAAFPVAMAFSYAAVSLLKSFLSIFFLPLKISAANLTDFSRKSAGS